MRLPTKLLICAMLILAVVVIFGRTYWFGFVDFDDSDYVRYFNARPAGLGMDNIRWAFTTFTFSNWHPLTWISYLVDRACFGIDPGMMHLENVLLHAGSSVLLFLLLEKSTAKPWRSALVAALFALHPVHVESVVWIAERKDVLSVFFLLLSWMIYVEYTANRSAAKYVLLCISYAASLASKSTGVTYPFLLILWDVWPLGRAVDPKGFDGRRAPWTMLILEKLPLLAMSIATCVLTYRAQKSGIFSLASVPLADRLSNAALSYVQYVGQLLVPMNLAVFYPLARTFPMQRVIAAAVLLIMTTAAVLRWGRKRLYLPVGWFWFLGALLPMIGLVQVGFQSMADRYNYLPSIGILILLVWGFADLMERCAISISIGAGLLVVIACATLTWIQIGYWKDANTLFNHALAVTDQNWFAHFHLGNVHAKQGDYIAAADEYATTIEMNPTYAEAYYNLGNCIYLVNPANAIPLYTKAIELAPKDARGYFNLGNAFYATGQMERAAEEYHRALELDPDSAAIRAAVKSTERN